MKKTLILLANLLLVISFSNAQKVDLDKYVFKSSMLRLPNNYIVPEMRTFDNRIDVSQDLQNFANSKLNNISIDGYTKTSTNPVITISGNINNLRLVSSDIKSSTSETKDKNGKVISTKTTYNVEAKFTGTGEYRITGPVNYYKSLKETTKTESKKSKKEKAKEEKEVANPFLNGTETKATLGTQDYKVETIRESMNRDYMYSSTSYNSYSDASNAWSRDRERELYNQKQKFVDEFINNVKNKASWEYGYTISSDNYHLWILDSKSHPEYDLQQKAIEAVKKIMPRLNGTANLTQMSTDIQPVMDYFKSLPAKYTGTDKADKKMRYSAYYNLAKLNYLLDNYKAVLENADLLIKNDYDKEDGEKLIDMANELKNQFDFYKIDSRQALN